MCEGTVEGQRGRCCTSWPNCKALVCQIWTGFGTYLMQISSFLAKSRDWALNKSGAVTALLTRKPVTSFPPWFRGKHTGNTYYCSYVFPLETGHLSSIKSDSPSIPTLCHGSLYISSLYCCSQQMSFESHFCKYVLTYTLRTAFLAS